VALDLGSFVNEEHRELRERLKITRLVPLRSGGGDSKCAW
jgi:hypothetical protein